MSALTLLQMIEATRLDEVKAAIVAALKARLASVAVVGHPGKLDVNDVVAKQVVAAPGVAVGWSRVRTDRQPDGSRLQHIDFVAFLVTQDMAIANRRVDRDIVAHAIGSAILDLLDDPAEQHWGLSRLERPAGEPAPDLKPVFTAKSWTEGVAYYAVTWSQTLWMEGALFGGATPPIRVDPDDVVVETDDGELPIELQAIAGRFFRGEDV